jgi:hypothetical protein
MHPTRISQALGDGFGFTLVIPAVWGVVLEASKLLVAFPRPAMRFDYASVTVEATSARLDITDLPVPEGADLEAHARDYVLRFLPGGEPERFEAVVGGRPALGFRWVDGVSEITTWIATPSDGAPLAVNVSWTVGLGTDGAPVVDDAEARAVVASFAWMTSASGTP